MGVRLRLIIGLIIFVVIYLVRTTNMGIWGGPVPNWEGVRMLPGSIGVLRVACPWVRCRAPPGGHHLKWQAGRLDPRLKICYEGPYD